MNLIAALTDLVVGALIMPFNIEYHYYGDHWMASALMCRIWNFGDVTVSSASIWTLAAIAMDRWMVHTHCVECIIQCSKISLKNYYLFGFFQAVYEPVTYMKLKNCSSFIILAGTSEF